MATKLLLLASLSCFCVSAIAAGAQSPAASPTTPATTHSPDNPPQPSATPPPSALPHPPPAQQPLPAHALAPGPAKHKKKHKHHHHHHHHTHAHAPKVPGPRALPKVQETDGKTSPAPSLTLYLNKGVSRRGRMRVIAGFAAATFFAITRFCS
ncbi:Unknown protein [Striga hermonthica]|uniref:Uncharacterized protein n=1 Tax=Striga hermonthica TaxID=68872 RepID=A0A9N7MY42_STRHE|nr:Unknown protein [Striga hermonthica]